MLNDLKQYTIKEEESIDELGNFIRLILERTKDELLLDYFVDTSRQNVWECKIRREQILLNYMYDFSLLEDIFHDLESRYKSQQNDYGCMSVVLLMIIYCFLDKSDIKIFIACDSTDYFCEELNQIAKNTNDGFTKVIEKWVIEMRRYFGISENDSFISLFRGTDPETGKIDELDNTCETYGNFIAIRLINRKKMSIFTKLMDHLGFAKFDNATYYVGDVDIYDGYSQTIQLEIQEATDLLLNKKQVRNSSLYQDIFISYSENTENQYMNELLNEITRIHSSFVEVIL